MGRILCNYHGKTGIVLACSHIKQDIRDRRTSEKIFKMSFFSELSFNPVLCYCLVCVNKYNFPSEDSLLPREKFNSVYDNEIFHPVCYQCFVELNEVNLQNKK